MENLTGTKHVSYASLKIFKIVGPLIKLLSDPMKVLLISPLLLGICTWGVKFVSRATDQCFGVVLA